MSESAQKPRNFLVLLSDEHDPRYTGCYGNPWIRTPNLDKLAARGTRFERAYTPSPICVPARSSLATGRYVHEIGYWDNAIAYEGRSTSWHQRLTNAGIRTESIGKLHFRREGDPSGFCAQHEAMNIQDGVGLVWGSVRDPLPRYRGPSPIFDELGPGESAYNRYDMRIAGRTVEWLEAHRDDPQPWALFVGFVAPHMPLVVPERYFSLYAQEAATLPKLLPRDGHARHPWVERMAQFWDHDAALGTDERRCIARQAYFGLVSFLDAQIGRVLDTLDRSGLAENTVVVYSSDHGDNLGARGLWNKSTLYRESTGIPMIVAGPGVPAGTTRRTNVGLVDVYPTALDAVGLAPIAEERGLPGRSLIQIASAADDLDRPGFSEYHAVGADGAAYMLASGRYKYHHYVNYPAELFDIVDDPEETINLAPCGDYRLVVEEFEARLKALLDPERVDARAKRDQRDLVARYGGAEKAWQVGNKGPTPAPDKYRMV
ncbi:sulfatase-like hydrolase/transferase [Paraburkholderia tagetis]|uniref:Sulfatase-like hydrolase/transferase n=1 Tax=Paraburkholderia tagetis TaxID=2913261 RepID=A0A9X1RPE4_9BURK|nr:sulfatase-like hydrolase/transferase [Paraburkholderia tagetis]MCG5073247.1 sulfatase-like hydrolase/transferase [Paraburkholderia tagetis]